MRIFLLGVLAARVSINHRYKRIFVQFPITKANIATQLKNEFGGSVYVKPYTDTKNSYTCFELKSNEGLKKLFKAVVEFDDQLQDGSLKELRDYLGELTL